MESGAEVLPGATALSSFCSKPQEERQFSAELACLLDVVAYTGKVWHAWEQLKLLVALRVDAVSTPSLSQQSKSTHFFDRDLRITRVQSRRFSPFSPLQVLQEYEKRRTSVVVGPPRPLATGESFADLRARLQHLLDSFSAPPFTIQRLCEVLLYPEETYTTLDKVALAIERLLLVTSTVAITKDPYPSLPLPPRAPPPPRYTPTLQKSAQQAPPQQAAGAVGDQQMEDRPPARNLTVPQGVPYQPEERQAAAGQNPREEAEEATPPGTPPGQSPVVQQLGEELPTTPPELKEQGIMRSLADNDEEMIDVVNGGNDISNGAAVLPAKEPVAEMAVVVEQVNNPSVVEPMSITQLSQVQSFEEGAGHAKEVPTPVAEGSEKPQVGPGLSGS